MIWAGAAESHTLRVDRVQHKFLIWLVSHCSSGYSESLSYPHLLRHFKIPSLSSRRVQHDILFLRNIFRGRLDSPTLLECFSFHVPTRSTRTQRLICVPRARVNTIMHGFMCRVPKHMNSFLTHEVSPDIFNDGMGTFRAKAIKYVLSL